MTNAKHIKGLPKLPNHLVAEIQASIDDNQNHPSKTSYNGIYDWLPANDKIQEWCNENISEDIYWGIQIITDDLPAHKDVGTVCKFNYLIAGATGDTNFYNDDNELIETVLLESDKWYILNTNVLHEVVGVKDVRISITGRITP